MIQSSFQLLPKKNDTILHCVTMFQLSYHIWISGSNLNWLIALNIVFTNTLQSNCSKWSKHSFLGIRSNAKFSEWNYLVVPQLICMKYETIIKIQCYMLWRSSNLNFDLWCEIIEVKSHHISLRDKYLIIKFCAGKFLEPWKKRFIRELILNPMFTECYSTHSYMTEEYIQNAV